MTNVYSHTNSNEENSKRSCMRLYPQGTGASTMMLTLEGYTYLGSVTRYTLCYMLTNGKRGVIIGRQFMD